MKVLVLHWGRNGGGPRFAADAVAGLRAAGVTTAYSYSLQSERASMDAGLADVALPVTTFRGGREAVLHSPRALRLGKRLRDYAVANQVDCVFAAMEQIWQPAVARAFRGTSIPYLLGMHDAEFHPGDRSPVGVVSRALEVGASDGLLTFSTTVTAALERTWTYPRDRVWETFLPVRVRPAQAARSQGPVRVGFFGRLQPYKGIAILVEAARLLEGRGANCVIEIHGDGSESALDRDDLPGNVVVRRGWTAEEDVEQVLRTFDVLVAPYLEASQSGVIPLAAALGVPSVVTPVGGLVEQVRHGGTGLVAARTDGSALADAISEIVRDEVLRGALAIRAAEEAASSRSAQSFGVVAAEAMHELTLKGKRARSD